MSTSSELILRSSNNLPAVIDGNSLFSYLEKIKKFPILTDKEELDLVTSFQQKSALSRRISAWPPKLLCHTAVTVCR